MNVLRMHIKVVYGLCYSHLLLINFCQQRKI